MHETARMTQPRCPEQLAKLYILASRFNNHRHKTLSKRQRRQTITPPRAVTGIVTHAQRRIRRKIAARTGTPVVNRTTHLPPDFAFQRYTARRRFVGAAHTHQRRRQRHRQSLRHPRRFGRRQIGAVKVHAKRRATRPTAKTSKIRHRWKNSSASKGGDCLAPEVWRQMERGRKFIALSPLSVGGSESLAVDRAFLHETKQNHQNNN